MPSQDEMPIAVPPTAMAPVPSTRAAPKVWWMSALIVALIITGFVLWYGPQRSGPSGPTYDLTQPAEPSQWATLGFLPASCNLVIGVRSADLPDRDDLLTRIPTSARDALEKSLGRPIQSIDEIALGVTVDGRALPGVMLVLLAQTPFDDALLAKQARSSEREGDRTYYTFEAPGSGFEWVAWLPSPQMLIASLSLDELEASPTNGKASLTDAMRGLISERLPADAAAWAVADMSDWDQFLIPRLLLGRILPNADAAGLADWQALAIAVTRGQQVDLRLHSTKAEAWHQRLPEMERKGDWLLLSKPTTAPEWATWASRWRSKNIKQP